MLTHKHDGVFRRKMAVTRCRKKAFLLDSETWEVSDMGTSFQNDAFRSIEWWKMAKPTPHMDSRDVIGAKTEENSKPICSTQGQFVSSEGLP